MERKRQICMKSKKGRRLKKKETGSRTCCLPRTEKKKKSPQLYFHITAVRKQLFSSSVAPNRFHVSDIRPRRIIAPAKLIQAPLYAHSHSCREMAFQSLLAGRLVPTCHNMFSSILPVIPPPSLPSPPHFFSPHPPLSCSVTLTSSLNPFMQCDVTAQLLWKQAANNHSELCGCGYVSVRSQSGIG